MAKSSTVHTRESERLLKIRFQAARFSEVRRVDAGSATFKIVVKCGTGKNLEELCRRMNWQVPNEHTTLQQLEGKFNGGSFVIRVNDKLSDAECELAYKTINAFAIHRLEIEGRKGKGFRRELRFNGSTEDPEACAAIESYMGRIGTSTGEMTVSFLKEEVQPELPLADPQAAQATLAEND
jgi:hypothetical protein